MGRVKELVQSCNILFLQWCARGCLLMFGCSPGFLLTENCVELLKILQEIRNLYKIKMRSEAEGDESVYFTSSVHDRHVHWRILVICVKIMRNKHCAMG